MKFHKIVDYKLRKEDISRYKLAKLLSTSPANIYRFLNGDNRMLGNEKLLALSKILNIESPHLKLGSDKPYDLINFLDLSNKELSFQKALLYLSILYNSQIYDYNDFDEQLDSIPITIAEFSERDINTDTETTLQFLTDIFLYSKTSPSLVIQRYINSRLYDVYSYVSFANHVPLVDGLEFSSKLIKQESKKTALSNNEIIDYALKLNFVMPTQDIMSIFKNTYRRRIDIYYHYLNGNLSLDQAEEKLLDLEIIEDRLCKPRFDELEYNLFRIFNDRRSDVDNTNNSSDQSQSRIICLLEYLDPEGFEMSYEYVSGLHGYICRKTRNHVVGIKIHDESLNKVFPKGSYAIVELKGDISNGNYALISINNQLPIIAKVTRLPEKDLLEFNSFFESKYPDITYKKEEITILGEVIEGIISI